MTYSTPIRLKKGLDIPISGEPEQRIHPGPPIKSIAVMGFDYIGIKPTMHVQEGDRVKIGQVLFTDKQNPSVSYTSPGSGIVSKINRGPRRVFQSVVIGIGGDAEITFAAYPQSKLQNLDRAQIKDNLTRSGMWACLRTRPYSKQPRPETNPHSIFINAMDTRPLAANPDVVIKEYQDDFIHGINVLAQLSPARLFVCHHENSDLPVVKRENIVYQAFTGPHPAGLPGTHIHFLDPVSADKSVWYINYQDVIGIGKLFTTGRIWTERVIALAGPMVKQPRLIRTRLGASTTDIVRDQLYDDPARIISGSVLAGRRATDWAAFLGKFHLQVSVIQETRDREFMGWIMPGKNKYSASRTFLSCLANKKFNLNSLVNGSQRAMVPIGSYEKVMPLDILPTQLLRALVTRDTDLAQALGCLELDEEDLALCSFVSNSKFNYGPILRGNLTQIEQEG
ncbi:MAG: Na(+)-translocating NADH-quinone reductase subunit A [Gammaproteobacteria bacterium]|nr:Na(+)-translocating NADH-quinone reductase subunit A [Gammaproteobacteria bacterium]